MNRTDLVKALAEVLDSEVQARTAVDAMFRAVTQGLADDGRVQITGFGSLTCEQVPSRMVRNPATGKKVRAKKTVHFRFKPSDSLKDVLTGRKKMAGVKVPRPTKGKATAAAKGKSKS